MSTPLPDELDPAARLAASAAAAMATEFGVDPEAVALAPGRINLIGEHTDYNDGFVLPMAIGRHVAVAFRSRDDGLVRAWTLHASERREAQVPALDPMRRGHGWFDYVAGTLWALRGAGFESPGLDLAIVADLPVGAGLSSSAALELAVARAASAAAGWTWDAPVMARLAQRAENGYVGTSCGVMDQFAVACAQAGHALLLDCRSLAFRLVALPPDAAFVVLDTGVRRRLVSSEYNDRRAACERAVARLQAGGRDVRALRDADVDDLTWLQGRVDADTWRRAAHVVAEVRRPEACAAALERGDLAAAGAAMNDSHASLRDLYEVSGPELDAIASLARAHPACYGARLTGAGFGGCAIALVDRGGVDAFAREVGERYRERRGGGGGVFAVSAVSGARLAG